MSPPPPDDAANTVRTVAVGVRAAGRQSIRLGQAQKQFNTLVQEADRLRATLARWRDCAPALEQRVATDIEPLFARYRAARVGLVTVLHAAFAGDQLGKRQKAKVAEIVCWHLAGILAEGPDDALAALYAEVAGHPIDEAPTGIAVPSTANGRARPTDARADSGPAAQARQEQLARGASHAVRDIYRRLASALHPDREPDDNERQRKTVLMQQANQAYAASDVLALLGLQREAGHLDDDALRMQARERLVQFNYLLKEQCQQLRDELDALVGSFAVNVMTDIRDVTPEAVAQALDREARELKHAAREYEAEVKQFRDIRRLERALDDYRLGELARADD